MEVQIFGIQKNADTRKALRFFAERRVRTHFMDLRERAASPGELRRFAQKFGVAQLVDRDSKRFAELGLRSAALSDDRWLEKLSEDNIVHLDDERRAAMVSNLMVVLCGERYLNPVVNAGTLYQ